MKKLILKTIYMEYTSFKVEADRYRSHGIDRKYNRHFCPSEISVTNPSKFPILPLKENPAIHSLQHPRHLACR